MPTSLHGIDIITPGTSTVDHVPDYNIEVCKISMCQEQSADKRLLCLDCFPPIARLCVDSQVSDITTFCTA